ncbi:MAG: high-potential iron-sulfur protein [Pseudomonadota bacterium]
MLTRRQLILRTALAAPLLTVANSLFAQGAAKLVAETDPVAQALKYNRDATKAPRADKPGTPAKDQHCGNCALYTKVGKVEGKEAGKCSMITGGLVTSAGWCTGWAKKA